MEKPEQHTNTSLEKELSVEEKKIIADFMEILLKDNRHKNLPICIMKEGIGKLTSLIIYEYCYIDKNLPLKTSTNKDWILNETEIKKLKDDNNKEIYNWKVSDFSIDISILEYRELKKSIKESTYTQLPERLLIYLSTPLIIDKNYSFMSFRTGNSYLGFTTIDSYTALLKKNSEGKWELDSKYYDPNSTW